MYYRAARRSITGVVVGAEEVAGVQVAFAPGFLRAPGKLPVVEAGAETAGVGVSGALVVAEAVVGEAQGIREHPAFTVVLGEEGFDALLAVAVGGFDLRFTGEVDAGKKYPLHVQVVGTRARTR